MTDSEIPFNVLPVIASELIGINSEADQIWYGQCLNMMPVMVILIREWCIFDNPENTPEAVLLRAMMEGR